MNPILDIFAAAQANASPTPAGAGISGQPVGDGLFAQLFADAVAANPQQTLMPPVGLQVKGLTDPEVAMMVNELTGNSIQTHEEQVFSEVVDQALANVQTAVPADGEVQVFPKQYSDSSTGDETTPAILDAVVPVHTPMGVESQVVAVRALMARVPSMELMSQLLATGTTKEQQSPLSGRVEAVLTSLTGEKATGAVINAQVEFSDEAAKAITVSGADEVAKVPAPDKNEGLIPDHKPAGKAVAVESHSLKSHLRKAFPSLNIESASGKVNVQVNLTNTDNETQTRIDLPISVQKTTAASGLPIAVAPQIAATVLTPAHAVKSARVNRQPQSTGKAPVHSPARIVVDDEAPVRLENRIAIRKPVQTALKSQGFDVEMLKSSDGSVKEPLTENIAIDKTDFKVSGDKHLQQATDRSLELNGTERFKLDIKRGHIEALLKKGEIKLQLQPEHLGHLKIKLTTTPTEVSARMETSSDDAKRAVELSLPQLRESFERAGLKLNSIEVLVNDNNDSRRQSAFQQEWRGRNGRSNSSADRFVADVPVVAEITQNSSTVYGGALNLVA